MFPESTILCIILNNREDPLHTYVHVRMYLKALYVVQPRRSALGSLTYMGSNMDIRTCMYLLVPSGNGMCV